MTAEAIVIGLVFLLAGAVKGVVGLGLPTVSLGLLTVTVGLDQAMALMLAPAFATNVWQAAVGGHFVSALRRIWPFLAAATVTVWIGVVLGAGSDTDLLASLLGVLLIAYGAFGLGRPFLAIGAKRERWAGPLTGSVNGILTGLTGSFVVPGVPYLQTLGLPRDQLVQAMGLLFTTSTVALALALSAGGKLPPEAGLASVLAVAPAVAGMIAGARVRSRIGEGAYRRGLLWSLIVLGLYICGHAVAELF